MNQSWKEYRNRSQTHECGIGTEAAQFTGKEYINGIFLSVYVMDSKQEHKIIKQESFILRQMFSILVVIKSAFIKVRTSLMDRKKRAGFRPVVFSYVVNDFPMGKESN